jgi:aryl-alcohol dehydrogenase-like predicted oxidoreductase
VPIRKQALLRSFERSLKRLQTDYIDLLFLHDPVTEITDHDEVFGALSALKASGKLRGFGLAVMHENLGAHRSYLSEIDVLQVNVPANDEDLRDLATTRANSPNVLFSPFKALDSAGSRSKYGSSAEAIASLSFEFERSVILCSMFSEKHIRSNVSALSEGGIPS